MSSKEQLVVNALSSTLNTFAWTMRHHHYLESFERGHISALLTCQVAAYAKVWDKNPMIVAAVAMCQCCCQFWFILAFSFVADYGRDYCWSEVILLVICRMWLVAHLHGSREILRLAWQHLNHASTVRLQRVFWYRHVSEHNILPLLVCANLHATHETVRFTPSSRRQNICGVAIPTLADKPHYRRPIGGR